MAQTPEGKVKDRVKKLLVQYGAYYYMPMQNGMGRVGVPDIVACMPSPVGGLFVAIETKAPGKRNNTTANQNREIDWIKRTGGVALVVDDAEQLKEVFDRLTGEHNDRSAQAQSLGAQDSQP